MVAITLPDGSVRKYDGSVSALKVNEDIGPELAKAALLARVDGQQWDLTRPIEADAELALITAKDDDAYELLRHDCAHVLAQAVQELFPGTQVTIGPAIENGFYYDFAREEPFSTEDFEKIEKRMAEIVDRDLPFVREVWDRDDAVNLFEEKGETYKLELIRDLPMDEVVTLYRQGDWVDLCRGPHLPSTGKLGKHFKLMKLAGAYWRGNSDNAMLQRIYGTCWPSKKELDAYLHMLEEAEKRDHRRLGREMDLFHQQEEAQGSVFWHPKGWHLWQTLETYMRNRLDEGGYEEVRTPQLVDRTLWEKSGHWDKFREAMFVSEAEDKIYALKPMNCPCHVQIFRQGLKSYRDLPLRMAEFGSCHRNEPSGALHGIMRVRAFTQDDAHIFCTEEQIQSETEHFVNLLYAVYEDMGFEDVVIKLATRPEKFGGTIERWDAAEKALGAALEATGHKYVVAEGEGAFYAPKLEFHLKDAIGRSWQVGTLQLDYVLPERLNATYVAEDGSRKYAVMLHRAILGTLERFIGIMIESCAGKLPLWLAPVQAVVATITSEADPYGLAVTEKLRAAGLRVESDTRNEKINYKVREHSVGKVPVIMVVGMKEAEENKVSIRRLGSKDQVVMDLDEAIAMLRAEATPPDLAREAKASFFM